MPRKISVLPGHRLLHLLIRKSGKQPKSSSSQTLVVSPQPQLLIKDATFEGLREEDEAYLRRKRRTTSPASPILRISASFSLVSKPSTSFSIPLRPALLPSLELKPEFAYLTFFTGSSFFVKQSYHSFFCINLLSPWKNPPPIVPT